MMQRLISLKPAELRQQVFMWDVVWDFHKQAELARALKFVFLEINGIGVEG